MRGFRLDSLNLYCQLGFGILRFSVLWLSLISANLDRQLPIKGLVVIILSHGLTFSFSVSRRQNAFMYFVWLSEQPATVFLIIKQPTACIYKACKIYVTIFLRLRPACQRLACTRFHARVGDWRFSFLRDSDRLVAQWRHRERAVCFCTRKVL